MEPFCSEHKYALSWSDLSFTVKGKGGAPKQILHNVSGHCQAGQMMALMGPSGSGKTTLLDLLADRVSSGSVEGKIMIGNRLRNVSSARKIVSYVMQEDALLSCFTPRETLRYAARLVLPGMSGEKREQRVVEAMGEMGLEGCADSRVGDPIIKGLSGGQKRRLSIAIELLQRSPILLLDEPTSGLDATSAFQVVNFLKSIADKGHTVAMSIHQPGTMTFRKFDLVCILAAGRQVYLGPVGQPAIDHFASVGHPCPEYTNPAEFFIEVVNTDFNPEMGVDGLQKLADAYTSSELAAKFRGAHLEDKDPKIYTDSVQLAGPCGQFVVLLHRMLNMSWKNPYIWLVRIVMYICLSVMVGTMYLGKGTTARDDDGQKGLDAAKALLPCLFYVQAFLVFMSVAILPFFLEIRDVFRRERANGQITCLPYVVADFIANLPGITCVALVSSVLVVFLADLNGFGGFFANLLLSLIVAESLMRVIGAGQPHYILGMAFGAGLFGMFMLCEGFMIPPPDIPVGWLWGYYMAFHTYSFEWFVHNQFNGKGGGAFGKPILKEFDMEGVDGTRNALILIGYALLFQMCFFLVLYKFHTGRR